ncbi:MAG: sulfotransferase family protein [Desulfatitalea sp.]|nr:sulfotransferase family protein [Desulfatitalea sp.]
MPDEQTTNKKRMNYRLKDDASGFMKLNFLSTLKKYFLHKDRKVLAVLGMHRSGTSCLIGSLQQAGLYLGKHNTWNPHNLKGNRENDDIVKFHDELLSDNGGSWRNPPLTVKWSKSHFKKARQIIAPYENHPFWGFKDPRTLLAFDGWKILIPDIQIVGIFRHPVPVVQSLMNRGVGIGLENEKVFDLWCHYNRIIVTEYHKRPFPVFSFDWNADIFHNKLNELLSSLQLSRIDHRDGFFAPDLVHYTQMQDARISKECRQLYQDLQAISSQPQIKERNNAAA